MNSPRTIRWHRADPVMPQPRTGAYVTDGTRLFRVVGRIAAASGRPFAALEDCLTLDVAAYGTDELYAMNLRPVSACLDAG